MPSGLSGDAGVLATRDLIAVEATGEHKESIVRASETIFLGMPKTGFFLGRSRDYTGNLHQVDLGLGQNFYNAAKSTSFLLEMKDLKSDLPHIRPSRHKYEAGMVSVIAGSPGMAGAAVLSSSAVLRSGAGMVHLFHPESMTAELNSAPAEIIRRLYELHSDEAKAPIAQLQNSLRRSKAVLLGPGLGQSKAAETLCAAVISICNSRTYHSLWMPMLSTYSHKINGLYQRPPF